jgi:hypothetical protein
LIRFDAIQVRTLVPFYWLAAEVAPGTCAVPGAGFTVVFGLTVARAGPVTTGNPPAPIATAPTKKMLRSIEFMAVSSNGCNTLSEAMLMPLPFSKFTLPGQVHRCNRNGIGVIV